jgi:xylulokinase
MKYILAVDHGTSGVKSALISVYGEVIDWEMEKTPLLLFDNGGAEQRTEDWWIAFLNTAKKIVSKNLVPVQDIVAISVTSQWGCCVPLDKDGNNLTNAISWMDSRGAPYVKKALKGIINVSGYSILNLLKWLPKTGGGPTLAGKDPIAHIVYKK